VKKKYGVRLTLVTDAEYPSIRGKSPQEKVKWKGFSEKLTIEVEDSEVLFHRRIVFTYPGDIDDLPVQKVKYIQTSEKRFCGRDMCYGLKDKVTGLVAATLFPEPNVSSMLYGKVNKQAVNVLEDKFSQYSGRGGSTGVLKQKFWNAMPFTIDYSPKVPGSDFMKASPTSAVKACYVLDVFRLGLDADRHVDSAPLVKAEALPEKAGGMVLDRMFPGRSRVNDPKGKEDEEVKSRVISEMNVYWYE